MHSWLFTSSYRLTLATGFVPPYALSQILSALDSTDPEAKSRAYLWTFITFLAHLSFAQVDVFELWHVRRCYERTRGQMFCTLHYKALKRQEVSGRVNAPGEMKNADLGKIVNLMQCVRSLAFPSHQFNFLQERRVYCGTAVLGTEPRLACTASYHTLHDIPLQVPNFLLQCFTIAHTCPAF